MDKNRALPVILAIAMVTGLGLAFAASATTTSATSSTSAASGAGNGQPPGPPPEAIAACQGKSEGTSVSFVDRGGQTRTGTCQTVNGVLAARPAGMGGGSGQRPPGGGQGGQPPQR